MCGIAGFAGRYADAPPLDSERTASALRAIQHRGPDAQGEYRARRIWLGHRRLSIIDLSAAANQPMVTADGDLVIIYNGEVYNFRELASQLSLNRLATSSDTEVVLQAFEKDGVKSFQMLNGMFAFAIYSKVSQKLWLVRDRLGIKPLYYSIDGDGLFFGSEIKAVLALTDRTAVCNSAALREWLYYGNTLGGRTLYDSIQQLPPGHYLELELCPFHHVVRSYWSLREVIAARGTAPEPVARIIPETRRLLESAVRRQLISDVPVGVFLSGGVDSTAITALAARHYNGKLTTYSAGFDDLAGVDERPKARRVAAYYGTDHHELHIRGANVADLVEKMVQHHDMPFSDAANIPLYLMASQISGQTKVVLQGDGGDEVFGGYRRYVSLRYRPLFRMLARADGLLDLALRARFSRRVRRYFGAFASEDLATTMARLLTPADPEASPEVLFAPALRAEIVKADPFVRYRECQSYFDGEDVGNQMSLVDLMVELPDIFLEKVDRATMAASLEVRVPFLDHDLVDYVVRIPGTRKMPWGRKKWLLKRVLHGLVPKFVLHGPKTGFNVPFGYWLRTSLKPLFFDHLTKFERDYRDVLSAPDVHRMFRAMESGESDRSHTLWNLLNLMVWANRRKVAFGNSESMRPAIGSFAVGQ